MRIYNTLSRSVEEFKPIGETVGIYTCGPTVYDYMHIGNLRTFVFADLFERTLRFNGLKLKTVQNITDIDDKIIKRAAERNISISELAFEYEKYFLEDVKKMNILPKDVVTNATKYVTKMQDYILELVEKGIAYVEKDGSVYFDISKFPSYGKLSGIEAKNLKTGTRVLSDEYLKEDVQDFALWKAEPKDQPGYASFWGWGRPGWHIECSVMSQENLGETIDVHMGGIDLIFPHHENEIAQSEAKSGKKFVNYWVHGAHILVDGKKMSKSLGNFYRLSDVTEKGIDPLALRYLYLQTHYRQEMNFTWEALEAAQTALNKIRRNYKAAKDGEVVIPEEFLDAINDDLNMPKALSNVWENIAELNKPTLDRIDEVLGLGLNSSQDEETEIPEKVKSLVEKREELRKAGNYEEADKIRNEIEDIGFVIEDSKDGIKVKKAK
jgi:cysteinyl-tRNA synthetase